MGRSGKEVKRGERSNMQLHTKGSEEGGGQVGVGIKSIEKHNQQHKGKCTELER